MRDGRKGSRSGQVEGESEVGGGRVDWGRTNVGLVDVGVEKRDGRLIRLVLEGGTE